MKEIIISEVDVVELLDSKPKEILHFISLLDVHKCKEYGDFNFLLMSERASTMFSSLSDNQENITDENITDQIDWLLIGVQINNFMSKCADDTYGTMKYEVSMMYFIIRGVQEFGEMPEIGITMSRVLDLFLLRVENCHDFEEVIELANHWQELEPIEWRVEQLRMLRYIKRFIQVVKLIKTEELYPLPERILRWIPLFEILP